MGGGISLICCCNSPFYSVGETKSCNLSIANLLKPPVELDIFFTDVIEKHEFSDPIIVRGSRLTGEVDIDYLKRHP